MCQFIQVNGPFQVGGVGVGWGSKGHSPLERMPNLFLNLKMLVLQGKALSPWQGYIFAEVCAIKSYTLVIYSVACQASVFFTV
jgi:hypothetical protein